MNCRHGLVLVCSLWSTAAWAQVPRPDHLLIVVEENKSFSAIFGNPDAPYINALAAGGAVFSGSYQVGLPSQPNYLGLFSGSNYGIGDDSMHPHDLFTGPNLAAKLIASGQTFTGYSETQPYVGYDGTSYSDSSTGSYKRKHNPWVNWQDTTDPLPANKLPISVNRPYTDFPSDFNQLPTVSFVVPNQRHDMHDGTIAEGDAWLSANLGAYADWAQTHNSLLIVTFDETDLTNLDLRIPTLFYGPMVKPGVYDELISHYYVLRTIEDMYGLPHSDGTLTATTITDVWVTVPEAGSSMLLAATTMLLGLVRFCRR